MAVISVNYVIVKSSAKIFEYSYAKNRILKFLSYYDFSWKITKTGNRINLCSPATFRRWKIFAESVETSQFKIILRIYLKLRSYLKTSTVWRLNSKPKILPGVRAFRTSQKLRNIRMRMPMRQIWLISWIRTISWRRPIDRIWSFGYWFG